MGKHAEVYGAEMLAVSRELETAIGFQRAKPEENRRQSGIILFADSTSSVTSIINEKPGSPGSSQLISQKFVEAAITCLDENRRASIDTSWVPGHMDITRNGGADEIAKEATEVQTTTDTTTIANSTDSYAKQGG